jgi:hypothetical protein
MPPKTMPELSGLGDSSDGSAFLSSTWASSSGGSTTALRRQNHQPAHLRPRSAPKNLSRTSNPFTGLWGRRGQQHQPQQGDLHVGMLGEAGAASAGPWKRISDDGTAVEVHEGRTTPPRSASGAPHGLKDAKEPTNTPEGGGPPPLTREEYETLPLAIQRKVRWLLVKIRKNNNSNKKTRPQRDLGRRGYSPFFFFFPFLPFSPLFSLSFFFFFSLFSCLQPPARPLFAAETSRRITMQSQWSSILSAAQVATGLSSIAPARQHLVT